jgi:hypothetical protein
LAPRNKPLSKEYIAWINMKVRCYNPNAQKHHYYGGKGITVCKRWRNSFANFIADMGPCPKGFTLDRINGNDSYRPGNCRWASWTQQQRNRGNNKLSVTKAALIRASAGTHRELAARFGCSTALIGFVKTGKYWKV